MNACPWYHIGFKNHNIVFFNGNPGMPGNHCTHLYTPTDQCSSGVSDKAINNATILSVNNTIYLAGGRNPGPGLYLREVWMPGPLIFAGVPFRRNILFFLTGRQASPKKNKYTTIIPAGIIVEQPPYAK
jgi:hypothetical protein